MNNILKSILLWVALFLIMIVIYQIAESVKGGPVVELKYSDFIKKVDSGEVVSAEFDQFKVTGKLKNKKKFSTIVPESSVGKLADKLINKGAVVIVDRPDKEDWFSNIFTLILVIVIGVGLGLLMIRFMQGGGSKAAFNFGKSKAKLLSPSQKKVTFKDVAGVDEAVEELEEIVEFLKEPFKFQRLGGRIPKGVLLVGPPGTGKTLLARAVAGEAGVPFFSISGSEFVEMFVGVGASRVRDLFDQGKKNAPCIIFIDEIDAVGRHRGAGLGGGHDEREQTLNQLLVEMDGIESNEGVILIAATNRPDVLDPALLRPGRFDRQVVVNLPDVNGRLGIFKVHTKNTPMCDDVDLEILARSTPGFSGAQIANLVNEAALLAAGKGKDCVAMEDFEMAKDKVLMGKERKSLALSDKEKKIIAYHEAGHTLVALSLPNTDPIHKVTIIPRGMALGVTQQLPQDDRYNYDREYLESEIKVLMGGRVAEEIIFGNMTTGAANDIERATELARKMVCAWGMSEKLGPLTFGKKDEMIFLGKELAQHKDYSEKTAELIDEEVRKVVLEGYKDAKRIVIEKREILEKLANALLEYEVLEGDDIYRLFNGKDISDKTKNKKEQKHSIKGQLDDEI